jgi:putative flippase GtrA
MAKPLGRDVEAWDVDIDGKYVGLGRSEMSSLRAGEEFLGLRLETGLGAHAYLTRMKVSNYALPRDFLKFVRFAVVGLVVMAVFMALNWIFSSSMSGQAAFFCAYPPALLLHFFLNKIWTFENRQKVDASQLSAYLVMVLVTFIIQWSVFSAIRAWTQLENWIAAGIANISQMVVGFIFMKLRVFVTNRAKE